MIICMFFFGEVLFLFVRLDELEKKEIVNVEFDQLDDFDEKEKSIFFDNDVRWEQLLIDKDKKSLLKRIKWKDCVSKKVNEKNGDDFDDDNSSDENDDNGDDDDVIIIIVKFSLLCKLIFREVSNIFDEVQIIVKLMYFLKEKFKLIF